MAGNRTTISELLILLGVDPRDFEEGMRDAENEARTFSQRVRRYFQNAADAMKSLGQKMSLAITMPLTVIGGAMTKMAMDATESENLFNVSLDKMADKARAWSNELSKSLGVNQYEIRKNIGTLYVMMNSMGLNEQAAYAMSRGLTQLAYDMASFYNLSPEEAFEKLKDGIVGEADPLQSLGILVGDETIKQYAYQNGIAKTGEELTEQQKVLARYGAIMKQTGKAQGDLARTMDSPTNKLRIAKSQYEEMSVAIGLKLLPALDKLLTGINKILKVFSKMPDSMQSAALVSIILAWAFGPLLMALSSTIILIPLLIDGFRRFARLRYVEAAINLITAAFTRLNMALLRNPLTWVVIAIAGAILLVARSSKTASAWMDQMIARLKALLGFDFEPPPLTAEDPEKAAIGYNEYAKSLAGAGQSAKQAAKDVKKFLAAFDEVYQIGEEEDDEDKQSVPTPTAGTTGGDNGTGGNDGGGGSATGNNGTLTPYFPGKNGITGPPTGIVTAFQAAMDNIKQILLQPLPVPLLPRLLSEPNPVPAWQRVLDQIRSLLQNPFPVPTIPNVNPAPETVSLWQTTLNAVQSFWENHKTKILVTAGLIIVGIVAWWAELPALALEAIAVLLPRLAAFFPRVIAAFSGLIDDVIAYFARMPDRIVSALASLPGKLLNIGRNAWSSFKSAFSGFSFKLPSLGGLGGGAVSIPAFATGAIATGPTFGLFGEAGDEAILPLNRINPIINTAVAGAMKDHAPARATIDYDRLAQAVIAGLQHANIIASFDTSNRSMTQLVRAMQPALANERSRRGGY